MFMLTSSLERAAFALLAVALSTATLAAATLLPMTSSPAAVFAKAKPTGAKGTYLQKVSLSSSMGPGVRVDIATLA